MNQLSTFAMEAHRLAKRHGLPFERGKQAVRLGSATVRFGPIAGISGYSKAYYLNAGKKTTAALSWQEAAQSALRLSRKFPIEAPSVPVVNVPVVAAPVGVGSL